MKDFINDFDVWQDALKKIDLNEAALPIYHGRMIYENVIEYQKMQKILNCPQMIKCHKYIYNLDPENLNESDCTKINNLYQLGCDRGFIEDTLTEPDLEELPMTDHTAEQPAPVKPIAYQRPSYKAKVPCYTIMYSATKDGQIKTGESYSNAINPRSAKADVYAKLSSLGYENISILAIECGDPDSCCCGDDSYTAADDLMCKTADTLLEDGDEESAPKKEEAPKEEAPKKETSKEEAPKEEAPKEEAPKEEAPKEEAPKEEAPNEETSDDSSSEDTTTDDNFDISAFDDSSNDEIDAEEVSDDSSEETSTEDTSSEETSANDTASEETSDEETSDEDTSSDDTTVDNTSSEETEPENNSKELDDNTKLEYKNEFKQIFKNIMLKCGFENRTFNSLSFDEKKKFFEELIPLWNKAEQQDFMSQEEIDQLNAVTIEQ